MMTNLGTNTWSLSDVKRALRAYNAAIYRDGETAADAAVSKLCPGAMLYITRRAVRGTADDESNYREALEAPGRLSDVAEVAAGYRAQAECRRWAVLVSA